MAFYGLDSGHQAFEEELYPLSHIAGLQTPLQKVIFKSQIYSVLFLSYFYMT